MPKLKPVKVPHQRALKLRPLAGQYCVARLAANAAIPPDFFCGEGLVSVTRTDAEVSLVYPEGRVVAAQKCETGWVGFVVEGVLDFAEVGILSRLSGALADAGISLFALSTYDTDVIFVKAEQETQARETLAKISTILE